MGYDPTDKWCSRNPYNKKKPVISGAKNKSVKYGSTVNVKSGVTAVNTTGMSVTSKIKVTIKYKGKKVSKIDTKQPGKYKVTYKVTDQIGRTAKKTVTYTVQQDKTKPVISGVKDQVIGANTKLTRKIAINGVTAKQSGVTLSTKKIKVNIVTKKKYYKVTYSVTSPYGKTAKATAKFTIDSKAPVFKGVSDREIEEDVIVDKDLALKGVSVTDDYTKKSKLTINVSIKDNKNNTYTITYTCEDAYGNVATKKVLFTRKVAEDTTLKIEGAKDLEIATGTAIDLEFAKDNGIKAYEGTKDVTDNMQIAINMLENGTCEVTYSISNENGENYSVEVVYTFKKEEDEEEHPGVG